MKEPANSSFENSLDVLWAKRRLVQLRIWWSFLSVKSALTASSNLTGLLSGKVKSASVMIPLRAVKEAPNYEGG
jgi:hypothetical protein